MIGFLNISSIAYVWLVTSPCMCLGRCKQCSVHECPYAQTHESFVLGPFSLNIMSYIRTNTNASKNTHESISAGGQRKTSLPYQLWRRMLCGGAHHSFAWYAQQQNSSPSQDRHDSPPSLMAILRMVSAEKHRKFGIKRWKRKNMRARRKNGKGSRRGRRKSLTKEEEEETSWTWSLSYMDLSITESTCKVSRKQHINLCNKPIFI